MKQVFVSYSRNNLEIVTQLIGDMKAMGIDAWHDQTLTGGQRWWDDILSNIRNCDIFVFALSPESWDSEACKSELSYVIKLGKPILPVLVADGVNLNLLTQPLSEIQVMDYRQCDKNAAFALVRSINAASTAPPVPDPLPQAPPVPVSYINTLTERIDSPEELSPQDQKMLIYDLEEGLRNGRSPIEVRDLLLRLKRRDELLAKIAIKIEAALKSLEEVIAAQKKSSMPEKVIRDQRGNQNKGNARQEASVEQQIECPKCRTLVEAGPRFCGNCGGELWKSDGTRPQPFMTPHSNSSVQTNSDITSRRYMCAPRETSQVIAGADAWLDSMGFDTQQVNMEDQSILLQIKKKGGWRDYVGMGTSLNILFRQSGDTLTVEIGGGKWMDKAAAGAVGMVFLWPLALTAGYGAWEQSQMPDKIFDYIAARLISL